MGSAVREFLFFAIFFAFSPAFGNDGAGQAKPGVDGSVECALWLDRMGNLSREPNEGELELARSGEAVTEAPAAEVAMQSIGAEVNRMTARAAAPANLPQRDMTPVAAKANQAEEVQAKIAQEKVEAALDAFEDLYKAVYGENYASGRPSKSMEKWKHFIANLYVSSPKRKIPEQILRGIQLRKKARLKEIGDKLVELKQLHTALGPSADALTPATLSAVEIFTKIGNARVNMVGGGPRDALMDVAKDVTENFDYMLQADAEEMIFDQKLRELTVVIAELVKDGLLDPKIPELKAAIDDVLVSNFCFVDPTVSKKTIDILLRYCGIGWRSFGRGKNWPEDRRQALESAVKALAISQTELERNIQLYAEGFSRGRIAFGTISTMTMPDAFEGIPLGHPLQDLAADMSNYPILVEAGVRAYGNAKKEGDPYNYLDLRVGGFVDSIQSAAQIYEERGVDGVGRMIESWFVNDLRTRRLAGRGARFRLQQAIDLLKEEAYARRMGYISPILTTISGGWFGNVVKNDKLKGLIPGDLANYLVKQIETGGREAPFDFKNTTPNPNVAVTNENGPPVTTSPPPPPTFRQRKIRTLPATMKHYLPELAHAMPWDGRKAAPDKPADGQPPHKDSRFYVFVDPDKHYVPAVNTPNPNENTPQANYLRALLRKLDQRAWALYHYGDLAIRTEAARNGHINHADVARYANDVNELLDVFQNDVMSAFAQCFNDTEGFTYEDAEETMAFYLLQNARYLKGFIMAGPPGALPGFYARTRPVLAGLGWRVGMLSVRLAFGDGLSDEPIYSRNQVQNPKIKIITARRAVALALVGVASWAAWHTHMFTDWTSVRNFFRSQPAVVAPADPGKPGKPNETPKTDPKPGGGQNDSQQDGDNN